MSLHPPVEFPAGHTSPAASSRAAENCGNSAPLLELRTDAGTVYVCPSKWQTLRLRWIFRHFHVLPQQVLSRRDQRLIKKLSRLTPVLPPPPSEKNTILGVVETPRTRSTPSAHQVITMRPRTWQPSLSLPSPESFFCEKPDPGYGKEAASARGWRRLSGAPFRQWGALGVFAAICFLVILAKVHFARPQNTVLGKKLPTPSSLAVQTAMRTTPPALPVPAIQPSKHSPAHPGPTSVVRSVASVAIPSRSSVTRSAMAALPTQSAAIALSAPREPVFVSELPQGHFAAPVVSNPNQTGELHLKASIAADGSVKDVTVVSGNPKLARAGIRAVRRWRYNPYQASATQGERETLINMKFFGQDAVSVTSLAR